MTRTTATGKLTSMTGPAATVVVTQKLGGAFQRIELLPPAMMRHAKRPARPIPLYLGHNLRSVPVQDAAKREQLDPALRTGRHGSPVRPHGVIDRPDIYL